LPIKPLRKKTKQNKKTLRIDESPAASLIIWLDVWLRPHRKDPSSELLSLAHRHITVVKGPCYGCTVLQKRNCLQWLF